MSDDEMRVAIAEKCGWKRGWNMSPTMWCNPAGAPIGFIPDYLTDLNACHEMERVLLAKQLPAYEDELRSVLGRFINANDKVPIATIYEWHATARQRCEAMCRTLWPERFNH